MGSVLCALGDACTSLRHEVSSAVLRKLSNVQVDEMERFYSELQAQAINVLVNQGIPTLRQRVKWEADLRYRGQATNLSVSFEIEELRSNGLQILRERSAFLLLCVPFDLLHAMRQIRTLTYTTILLFSGT
jgi:5-oxoprolinase (ATP-hydrolysing)